VSKCQARVAKRRAPRPTPYELEHGIPIFIGQLEAMLTIPPPQQVGLEIEQTAVSHGGELLRHQFTIDQVVHDYGDLCQAITELAVERGQPISVPEFATLNMKLDSAIAAAVGEWSRKREMDLERRHATELNERLGVLGHEMRNQLNTTILALTAIRKGTLGFGGATAAALDRSVIAMRDLIDRALSDVRLHAVGSTSLALEPIDVASFLLDVQVAGALEASSHACELTVALPPPGIIVEADRQILAAAVANLLQNAFKFTRKGGHVELRAQARDRRVYIEVEDECGGLPPDAQEVIFRPFKQAGRDRSGVGLGLAISRKGVEEHGGKLSVRDMPGRGCVFTIELPRYGENVSSKPEA
jgi:signal transduction histidine kinase